VRLYTIMQLAFEQAFRRFPDRLHESSFRFGGYPIRVRVVGHEMAKQITRPFCHLESDTSNVETPQLTIDLWDESETNIQCQVGSPNGNHSRIKMTAISPDGRLVGQKLRNVLTYYNHSAQHIISSVVWNDQLSVYERCKPLARPLLEWHNDRNVQMIHGSLVARDGRGVLFGGKSGSGKSTSALTCVCAGFQFLSEDYVGLQEICDGSFLGHSLYNSVFLKIIDLLRFPSFGPYVMKGLAHEEKAAVLLSQVFPDRLASAVPIRAVVLPRIVHSAEAKFYLASKGEALLSVGPSSLLEIPSRRVGVLGFHKIAKLIERIPCYWLEINRDLASIPHRVEELLVAARAL